MVDGSLEALAAVDADATPVGLAVSVVADSLVVGGWEPVQAARRAADTRARPRVRRGVLLMVSSHSWHPHTDPLMGASRFPLGTGAAPTQVVMTRGIGNLARF